MQQIDVDENSGAEIWRLDDDERPTDNIYGEQPYGSEDGSRLTLRHYATDEIAGGLSILDLEEGRQISIVDDEPRFPAFHGWGQHLYGQQVVDDRLVLRRWDYRSLEVEDLADLPQHEGRFSYGTVSADGKHYAVCVHNDPPAPCRVLLFDLIAGSYGELAASEDRYFKHEQFSRDGRDLVMLQANSADVSLVGLAAVDLTGDLTWFAADAPHTPRPSGHEAWIGGESQIFYSTRWDDERGNLWTATLGEDNSTSLGPAVKGSHVSVSRCDNFWLVDDGSVPDVPLHIGCFASGESRRLVSTSTVHDGQQWSHAHPYLTADNRWAVFTSNRHGDSHVYGARLPRDFLSGLLP